MSAWLKFLPFEIKEVNKLIEPIEEVKEGETVVGTISDELKKIWTLHQSLKKSGELMQIDIKYNKASSEVMGNISELMSKARGLEVIFWIGAHDELHLWDNFDLLGLRVGWQVISYKQPAMPAFFKLFSGTDQ